MKTKVLLFLMLLFAYGTAYSLGNVIYRTQPAVNDTGQDSIRQHRLDYLLKANNDKDNNRFEIFNKNRTFKMSIGGYISLITMYDFGGTINSTNFITSLIPVPTNLENQFTMYANMSRLNFKVEGIVNNRPLVGFIEADFRGAKNNSFRLRHAYVSYYGFTVGQTWSTFMDLEASPETIDGEGPNNEIAVRQPLIRYTYLHKNWEFALGVEMPLNSISSDPDDGKNLPLLKVYEQKRHYPDIPFHIKYKGDFGHVQVGAVFRLLNYGDSLSGHPKTVTVPAGGASISGTFNIGKRTQILYQFNGGAGIANYMQDISDFNYDLVPDSYIGDGLKASVMYGGYLACSHKWSKKLSSNIIYGILKLELPYKRDLPVISYSDLYYNYAQYLAVNTFWNVIPFGELGLESIWGQRVNTNGESGVANRINFLVRYSF